MRVLFSTTPSPQPRTRWSTSSSKGLSHPIPSAAASMSSRYFIWRMGSPVALGVAAAEQVFASDFKRIDSNPLRDLVDSALVCPADPARHCAAEGAGRHSVGITAARTHQYVGMLYGPARESSLVELRAASTRYRHRRCRQRQSWGQAISRPYTLAPVVIVTVAECFAAIAKISSRRSSMRTGRPTLLAQIDAIASSRRVNLGPNPPPMLSVRTRIRSD